MYLEGNSQHKTPTNAQSKTDLLHVLKSVLTDLLHRLKPALTNLLHGLHLCDPMRP